MKDKSKKTSSVGQPLPPSVPPPWPQKPEAAPPSRLAEIEALLGSYRLPCSSERELQEAMEKIFLANDIPHEREKILDRGNIVDFFLYGTLAIECKVHVQPGAVFRQVERYLAFDQVKELLLVTSKHMGLPPVVNGKKTGVYKVGMSWL